MTNLGWNMRTCHNGFGVKQPVNKLNVLVQEDWFFFALRIQLKQIFIKKNNLIEERKKNNDKYNI